MNLTQNKLDKSVKLMKPPLKRSSALPLKGYKKIKIGLFGGSPIWNAKSTLGTAKTKKNETKSTFKATSDVNDLKQEKTNKQENRSFQINKVTTEGTDYKNYNDKEVFNSEITLNSVASEHPFDDSSAVKNLDSSDVHEILTSSPLDISETLQEDFVLFASDVVDFVEHDSNMKNNLTSNKFGDYSIKMQKPINKQITSGTQNKKNTMINNKGNSTPSVLAVPAPTCESLDVQNVQCIRKSVEDRSDILRDSENVELVLLPRPENKMNVDTGSQNSGTTTCVSISSNLPKHNAGRYSRIGSCLSKNMIVNRTGINTPNKSHPIVVTTKRLMSEVTQTTAKVSIGNTTISVPLLKPIISPHIISNDSQKYHTVQHQMQNQQQFQHNINSQVTNTNNQPKILNVKRGNKINPPTVVSLSQLQIKPSATGKIVQATVVGKKIQFPKITIDTPTTITSASCTKSDVFHTLSYPKLSQLTVLQDVSLPSKILEDESSSPKSSSSSPTEVSQKTEQPDSIVANVHKYDCSTKNVPKIKVGSFASSNTAKSSQHVTEMTSTNTTVKSLPQLSPFVKTELAANMPKSVSQQLKAIMNNAVKTQGQKVSLSVSTDLSLPQMRFKTSSPTITAVSSEMQEYRIAKTTVSVAPLSAKVSSTPLLTVPKTISLMLTKNSAASKTSNVLLTENSNQVTNKIHLSKVGSMLPSLSSKAVALSVQLDAKYFHSPPSDKNTTNQLNTQIQMPIKRSKSTDEFKYEVETNEIISSKKNGAEIPLSKRSHSLDNNVCSSLPLTASSTTSSTFSHLASEIDGNDTQNLITSVSSYCPPNTSVGRNEDAQNVLLKQLLQSTNNQTQTTICNQTLPGRKVISVRAPSLGLVSSLEAQLARPVMPPVPTATTILPSPKHQPRTIESVPESMESSSKNTFIELNEKSKQCIPKISKETSFISKPSLSPSVSPSPVIPLNSPKNESCITFKTCTNIMGTPTVSGVSSKINNTNIQAYSNLNMYSNVNTICNGSKRSGFPEEAYSGRNKMFSPSSEESGLNNTQISSLSKLHSKDMHTLQPNLCLETSVDNCSSDNIFCETIPSREKFANSQLLGRKASQIEYDKSNLHDKYSEKSKVNQSASAFASKTTLTLTVTSAKDVELRKKRKREYQKHRRQLINNKESCGQTKKRSRKTSKIEEDYDSFIDSLMAQIRQMSSLQVLEPLLGRSFSICSLYGAMDLSKISNSKEYSDLIQNEFLQGEFGNARRADISDFYHMKPFGSTEKTFDQDLSSIQNGFYDQEFSPVLFEDEAEKLRSFINVLKEKNIEMVENILIGSSFNEQKLHATNTSYPGTVLINDCHSFIGRMSPIVPVIKPFPLKKNNGMNADPDLSNRFKHIYGNNFKNRRNSAVPDDGENQRNLTVVLTLSSKAAKNILGVLCDLANILNLSTLGKYKIVDPSSNLKNMGFYKLKYKIANNCKSNNSVTNIQKIINGTNKLCRNCDKAIMYNAIQVNSKAMAKKLPPAKLYFCNKTCYAHFQFDVHSQRSLMKSSSASDNCCSKKIGADKNSVLAPTTISSHNSPCRDKVIRYKYYNSKSFPPLTKLKKISEKEVADILFKMDITLTAQTCSSNGNTIAKRIEDTRQCIFCNLRGDCISDGPSRLLNFDVDKWIHLNCALWSNGVYETISGGLMNLEIALQAGLNQTCTVCHQLGATIKCFKNRCGNVYHLPCAMKEKSVFYKNKTMHCSTHAMKTEKENELTTLSVQRRVFVERDESRQVAAVMHHSELSNLLRVGSLTFLSIGQLLPHQLEAFHTANYIYPIGYKIIRFYWSMNIPNKRCRYICTIAEVGGRPEFRIQVQEPSQCEVEFRDSTPKAVWQKVLQPIAALREKNGLVQLFPKFITGEDLFGLTEPAIVRILESLPGIETLTDYRFKYGRNPLLELPLAINPSGSARSEPKQRQVVGWKKPHTQRTSSSTNQRLTSSVASLVAGEVACPYSKQFVHSKSSQYKKMKQEWRNNVYLARSKIQGLGLYAARDLEKHTMVIEYIGEVIRTEVSELREKQYEAKNRGIYMFRLDEERVVDATLSGGLARYINHSCNPNCVTEIVDVDREYRIIIFAKRRVSRGEELSYDYKFDIEDDAHKISCMCGAPNCRKWMN